MPDRADMFHCSHEPCAMGAAKLPSAAAAQLSHRCPLCGAALVSSSATSATPAPEAASALLDSLPWVVAYPLAHAVDDELSPADRLHNVIFAAYQAMRLVSLVLLADYLRCDASSRSVQDRIGGLRVPHWGEWTSLTHALCKFWSGAGAEGERAERPTAFPELVRGWQKVASVRRGGDSASETLLAGLGGVQDQRQARTLNDALWRLRNDTAHRAATRTIDQARTRAQLARFLPLLQRSCEQMFPAGALRVVRCVELADAVSGAGWSALQLHGARLDRQHERRPLQLPATADDLAPGDVVALGSAGHASLSPLAVSDDDEPLALLDDATKRRLVLLGVRRSIERPDLAQPFFEALARKNAGLGLERRQSLPWTVATWSQINARLSVDARRGSEYLPQCYVERLAREGAARGVDDALARAVDRSAAAVLVLGEDGVGKTSLVCHLVERLVTDRREQADSAMQLLDGRIDRDVVLFLCGGQAYAGAAGDDGGRLLRDALLEQAGVRPSDFADVADFLAHLDSAMKTDSQRDRRVWLLLDGLDEADRFADIAAAVADIAALAQRYPWLRLVVSLRAAAYHALQQRGDAPLGDPAAWQHFDDAHGEATPYLPIRPFDVDEGRLAYVRRQQALPEQAAKIAYEQLTPDVRQLLLTPLHLHLFHATYRARETLTELTDPLALFDAHLEVLCSEIDGVRETLAAIGKLMLERRSPLVPLDAAERLRASWARERGASSLQRACKLDPIEELVAAGVLVRPAGDGAGARGYQFAHEALCRQVLLRELACRVAPRTLPDGAQLLSWARDAAANDFSELLGALAVVSARLASSGDGDAIAALLELEDEGARTHLLQTALCNVEQADAHAAHTSRAAAMLDSLFEAGGRGADAGHRLLVAGSAASRWLESIGCSAAALDINERCLRLARARLALEPQHHGLQRALCTALNDMARAALMLGDARRALDINTELEALVRRLIAAEPQRQVLRRDLSVVLTDLCKLSNNTGDSEGAQRFADEAIVELRTLLEAQPESADFRMLLAAALGAAVEVARDTGDRERAWLWAEEHLELSRALVEAEPERADLRVALTVALNSVGRLAEWDGRMKQAEGCFGEALQVMRALVDSQPHRSDLPRELAFALECAGRVAFAVGRIQQAQNCYEESMTLMRRLADAEPHRGDLQHDLSVSLSRLAALANAIGRDSEARACHEEALQRLRRVLASSPARIDVARQLTVSLNNLGDLERSAGYSERARQRFEEAALVTTWLTHVEPQRTDLKSDLSTAYNNLALSATDAAHWPQARHYFEKGLQLLRELVAIEGQRTDLRGELATSLHNVGHVLRACGDLDAAREYLVEMLEIMRALCEAEPDRADLRDELAKGLSTLGQLAMEQTRLDEARAYFDEALDTVRALLAAQPERTDLQRSLSIALGNAGNLARNAGAIHEAKRYHDEELDVARALLAGEPYRLDLRLDLAICCWNQYIIASERNAELRYLRMVLETLAPARESAEIDNAEIAKLWDLASKELEERTSPQS
ncbi:MAG: tetratricopeptide repeat protein [Myxococcales bacterium]|nr:tetratricopeptide repeat protein [Myxococcales bacterium]